MPEAQACESCAGDPTIKNLRLIRCSARDTMAPGARDAYIGFRVVRDSGSDPRADIDWVDITAGPFWMGSEPAVRRQPVLPDETPEHLVDLPAFRIAQAPVTNEQYREFVRDTGRVAPSPSPWSEGDIPTGLERHPVTHVDWHDARAYFAWAAVRLPTEAEWERAAAGSGLEADARIFPWGDEAPTAERANYRDSGRDASTTPGDRYPLGTTPDGVLDMAGNVWEWVSTLHGPYPYDPSDGRERLDHSGRRVVRGGSFLSPGQAYPRCAMRSLSYPSRRREHIEFRVAFDL
jgi:toxoflavin biosynthesis protein ToxD